MPFDVKSWRVRLETRISDVLSADPEFALIQKEYLDEADRLFREMKKADPKMSDAETEHLVSEILREEDEEED